MIDRDTAARLGITASQIDNTLYDAFGQRQVSTIYSARNQYHVIMEVAPQYWQNPETLKDVFVSTSGGAVGGVQGTNAVAGTVKGTGQASATATIAADAARNQSSNALGNTGRGAVSTGSAVSASAEKMVPLSAFTTFGPGSTPLAINHDGLFVATTMSFNLTPGASLSDAVTAVANAMNRIGVPATIHGNFQGTAQAYQQSIANEPYLIAAALIAVYIVLGILYESYIHPITILSTLPSAGVGAVLALLVFRTEFSIIALIGVILLIGIVKKNAILMIDFALDAERQRGLSSREAIYQACLLRFRPDHDDHDGRVARCHPACHGPRRRLGAAPSARHRDRRRADRQPDADALYDAGDLSLSRSFQPMVPAPLVFGPSTDHRLQPPRYRRMRPTPWWHPPRCAGVRLRTSDASNDPSTTAC